MTEAGAAGEESILARTARAAGWVIGWRMLTRALGLVSTLFLVRLLLPADFGLVTLAVSFGQALDSLSSLGVEEAVIREPSPTRELYDSAFTINVIRGVASAAIVAAAAWPVAQFFADGRLLPVMLVLAGVSLVGAFENIGIVDFRRDLTFEKEFVLMAVPRLISIFVAIGLAWLLRSYWALVCSIVVSAVVRTGLGYVMHPCRPRFGLRAWRQIAGFSFWSWLLSLTALVNDRCASFVIGRLFGIAEVGVFAVGAEIAALPTTELISPLSRACFSGFASARSSGSAADSAQAFLRVVASTALLALPAGVGISLVAGPIVALAFGPNWTGAVPVIQVLGVALTLYVVGMIGGAMMSAHARLRRMFWVQLLAVVVKLGLLLALVVPYGLLGAAVAAGLAAALEQLLILAVTLRYLRVGLGALLAATWRSMAAAAMMAAGMAAAGLGWTGGRLGDAGAALELAVAIPFGAALYGAAVLVGWLLAGRPAGPERDLAAMLRRGGGRAFSVAARQLRVVGLGG